MSYTITIKNNETGAKRVVATENVCVAKYDETCDGGYTGFYITEGINVLDLMKMHIDLKAIILQMTDNDIAKYDKVSNEILNTRKGDFSNLIELL